MSAGLHTEFNQYISEFEVPRYAKQATPARLWLYIINLQNIEQSSPQEGLEETEILDDPLLFYLSCDQQTCIEALVLA